jgi:hypothetical protein
MNVNEKHKPKIIIWGYDRNDHTQYYIHWAWYRTFEYLGYETHWFTDENHPKDFDYTNCLFIAEGYRDNNIPINKSSVYFINFLINPGKYLQHGARVIDIKLNVNEINDCNYNYELDRSKTIKVGNCAYYENNSSDDDLTFRKWKELVKMESIPLTGAFISASIDFSLPLSLPRRSTNIHITRTMPLKTIIDNIDNHSIHVHGTQSTWTVSIAKAFIQAIMAGRSFPPLIIDTNHIVPSILDGKQRILAASQFRKDIFTDIDGKLFSSLSESEKYWFDTYMVTTDTV